MLVKYWQAALLAAMIGLAGSAAQAQDCCQQQSCPAKSSCPIQQTSGIILKVNREAFQAKKCDCAKGGDCCCGKKCECGKDKARSCCNDNECCKESCKGCCAAKNKQAKKAVIHGAIVVTVPVPVPVGGPYPIAPPCMIPPVTAMSGRSPLANPLPPPPPMLLPPGVPTPTLASPIMPPRAVALPAPPPPACCPCPMGGNGSYDAAPVLVCPASSSADVNIENCLSILGIVGELCCTHLNHNSLPVMCLSSLGMLMDLCQQPAVLAPTPGKYLPHPPQYVPPSPPFPLSRELFAQEAPAATLLPPPRPECPAYPVANAPQPCPIPAATTPALPAAPCSGMKALNTTPNSMVLVADLTPASARRVRITAKQDSDQLEIASPTLDFVSCKKMVIRVGESEIKLTCLDGQVRVRGEELKAKADCVCPDRIGGLVLDGDVVLSYKKHGQSTRVIGDHVELNLATGSVTVKSAGKLSCTPERVHGGLTP